MTLRLWIESAAEQRAVYAWAVRQQQPGQESLSAASPTPASVTDPAVLRLAKRAKRGELRDDEIAALQALRPNMLYPGKLPDSMPQVLRLYPGWTPPPPPPSDWPA